jgi:hypothetical protein
MKTFNNFLKDLLHILHENANSPVESELIDAMVGLRGEGLLNPITGTSISKTELFNLAQRIHGAHRLGLGEDGPRNVESQQWNQLDSDAQGKYVSHAIHAIHSIAVTGLGKNLNDPDLFKGTMDHYLVKVDPKAISNESDVTHHRHAMVAVLQELQK